MWDTYINPADLGVYYLNSRYYDAEIGRFINADTIDLVFASQTTLNDKNLYAYCNNNPIGYVDTEGYFAVSAIIFKATVDAAIGMITTTIILNTTGQKIEPMELLGVGLAAGFNSTLLKAVPENAAVPQRVITAVFGTTDSYITEGLNLLIESIATPKPTVLVVKELVRRNKRVVKATYVKGGKSCAVK